MDKTHKEKHEKDVQSVIYTIQSMVNPFDTTQPNLVHLASGVIAPAAIQHDLLSAKSLGEERFRVFVQENLLSDKPDVFDTIQKTKLQTFSLTLKPTKTTTSKGKEEAAESKNDESILINIRDKDCVAIEVKYHNR